MNNLFAVNINMGQVTDEVNVYFKKGNVNSLWDDYVVKGFKSYATSDFDNASINLQKAYNLGCRDGFVLFRLTISYASRNMCQKAIKYGKESAAYYQKQYPDKFKDTSLFQVMGDCSCGDQAIEFYKQGLRNNPTDVSIRLNMAHKLAETGRLDEARKEFLDIVKEGQISSYGYGVAYNGLGKIERDRKNFKKAIEYYEKAYKSRGRGSDAWGIAMAYEGIKDYKTARYYWQEAAKIYGHENEWGQSALKRAQQLEGY